MNLRVWHQYPPNDPIFYRVNSTEEAIEKINELAKKDLKNPRVVINAFGLEENIHFPFDNWEEWYDEDGFDIVQVMEKEEE